MTGNEKGFSLLELVIALLVLGVAATGLFSLNSMSAVGNNRSQERITATALAVEKLEKLKEESFANLVAGSFSDPAVDAAGSSEDGSHTRYERSWTATPTTIGTTPAMTLTVTVGWPGGDTVTISTQRVNPSLVTSLGVSAFPTVSTRGWRQVQ